MNLFLPLFVPKFSVNNMAFQVIITPLIYINTGRGVRRKNATCAQIRGHKSGKHELNVALWEERFEDERI